MKRLLLALCFTHRKTQFHCLHQYELSRRAVPPLLQPFPGTAHMVVSTHTASRTGTLITDYRGHGLSASGHFRRMYSLLGRYQNILLVGLGFHVKHSN